MEIHPTAIVSPGARLAEGAVIHPYCVIGPHVSIGQGTVIGPHAVIDGWTTIGARNQIHPFVSIGQPPQDTSYKGEETHVVIGDDNTFKEGVTVHRGTPGGKTVTTIGNHNFFMAYAHVAHDCVVGNHVVMANAATLGGHVHVGDHASLGGLSAVHQFARIGVHVFIGGLSAIRKDVPPFMLASGNPLQLYGPNVVGLRRAGISREVIQGLKKSYRILFRTPMLLEDAIAKLRHEVKPAAEVDTLVQFMQNPSRRGVMRLGHDASGA